MAAVCDVKIVIRQDFIGLNYSLLTADYVPTPVSSLHSGNSLIRTPFGQIKVS